MNKSRSWSLNNIGVSTANLMLSTKSQLPLRSLFCVSHIYICIFGILHVMVWEKKPAFLLLQVLQSQKKLFLLSSVFSSPVAEHCGGHRMGPGCQPEAEARMHLLKYQYWGTVHLLKCVNVGVLWYFAPFEVLYSFICCHLTFYCRTREVEAFSFGRRIFWIFDKWPMAG